MTGSPSGAAAAAVLPVVVIGCGNLLRSDDAVGPLLVRRMWEHGVPDGVELVDGGTAGMDVAFKMRARRKVVIVDACVSGAEPGTVFRVPGSEVESAPLDGLHSHSFRWDHAISFGRWLLKEDFPADVVVVLVEALHTGFGDELSAPVHGAMTRALDVVMAEIGAAAATRDG